VIVLPSRLWPRPLSSTAIICRIYEYIYDSEGNETLTFWASNNLSRYDQKLFHCYSKSFYWLIAAVEISVALLLVQRLSCFFSRSDPVLWMRWSDEIRVSSGEARINVSVSATCPLNSCHIFCHRRPTSREKQPPTYVQIVWFPPSLISPKC